MSREGALWIGGLEPYMDEEYLTKAFNAMGEENVQSIKVSNLVKYYVYYLYLKP